VSVGTATVALVLNGLGFSNRQLYLVPQFFADKPIEHLLGPGITADALNDDCLARTLDGLVYWGYPVLRWWCERWTGSGSMTAS